MSVSNIDPEDILANYRTDIRNSDVNLSWDEQKKLFELYKKNGDLDARNKIVEANLPLVLSWAKKAYDIYRQIPFEDLVQEGNMGLLAAVDKFDLNKGTRFSTMAVPWIRAYIQKFIKDQCLLSDKKYNIATKIKRAEVSLYQKLHREPTDEEIAADIGGGLESEDVSAIREAAKSCISLDNPVSTDDTDGRTLIDNIPDETSDADNMGSLDVDLERLKIALARLDRRERMVIFLREGFNEEQKSYTFPEIGVKLNVSKQRASQIYNEALAKLKSFLTKGDSVEK